MNLLVLISSIERDGVVDNLIKLSKRYRVFIVSSKSTADTIGRKISSVNNGVGTLNFTVFNTRNIEENSLKIIVNAQPDIVVDCDQWNELNAIKKLLHSMNIVIKHCKELDNLLDSTMQ